MSESLAISQELKYYTLYSYIRDAEFSPHSLYFPTLHVKGVMLRIYGLFPWNQTNKQKNLWPRSCCQQTSKHFVDMCPILPASGSMAGWSSPSWASEESVSGRQQADLTLTLIFLAWKAAPESSMWVLFSFFFFLFFSSCSLFSSSNT